uniref:Uncharacterized protein n=1 Tax=Glossina palpalis gambiensis TaxID=67801 RepID=A0A1B0BRR5_9MUSC
MGWTGVLSRFNHLYRSIFCYQYQGFKLIWSLDRIYEFSFSNHSLRQLITVSLMEVKYRGQQQSGNIIKHCLSKRPRNITFPAYKRNEDITVGLCKTPEVKSSHMNEEVSSILKTDDTLIVREEIVNFTSEKYFEGMH